MLEMYPYFLINPFTYQQACRIFNNGKTPRESRQHVVNIIDILQIVFATHLGHKLLARRWSMPHLYQKQGEGSNEVAIRLDFVQTFWIQNTHLLAMMCEEKKY